VRDDGEKRPRRPAWHTFALFPIADCLNRNPKTRREFLLREARTPAKVAHGSRRTPVGGRHGSNRRSAQRRRWRKRKLAPIAQLDDPSIGLQTQALHIRLPLKSVG
jgi:hypothetical protein